MSSDYDASEDQEINFNKLFGTIFDGRYLIIFFTLLSLTVGVTMALVLKPIYQSDALVQIEQKSSVFDSMDSISPLLEGKVPSDTEIEIIKSRLILGEAIKRLNLDIIATPNYFPIIGEAISRRFIPRSLDTNVSDAPFDMNKYAWGGEEINVDTFSVPDALKHHVFNLVSEENGRFSLFDDDQKVLDGEVGKPVFKELAENNGSISLFVSRLKARPGTIFNISKEFLNSAIEELRTNLSVSEKGKKTGILLLSIENSNPLLAYQIVNEVANIYVQQNVEQKSKEAQNRLLFLEKQLPILKEQVDTSMTALNNYRTKTGSIDLDLETQNILAGVVRIQTEITILLQKRDDLRRMFTESHPALIALDKQIARLQGQMNESNTKIEELPETQRVILRLSSELKVNTELYTTLLNTAQTLKVAKAGTVGNVRIIDQAFLPFEPIKPKKSIIIAVSFVLGLFFGLLVIFVRKALYPTIEDPDIVESLSGITVYATVPRSDYQFKMQNSNSINFQHRVLAVAKNDDLTVESLKSLRTTLHFLIDQAVNNIITITSPSPNVGKSFTSVNLAAVLAQTGNKVILLDCDLRKGTVNEYFKTPRQLGLSELILGEIQLADAIRCFNVDYKLDYIACGSFPSNPSELFLTNRFKEILNFLSQEYDSIIIDTPPVLAVTDPLIIGKLSGINLMIIKSGAHTSRELKQAVNQFELTALQLNGIIMNQISLSKKGHSYGNYVYQYKYGDSK